MKKITCELCGSNNIVKQGGMFVCQNCGTKYSLEEAKKMMNEGTVKVDNTNMIENYLEIANRAFQSSNSTEAESYCNKVIEIDPNNYRALMLKGKAAGWQTTIQNNRFTEAINCFCSAIKNAPDKEKKALINEAKSQVENLSSALMKVQGNRFTKWPDDEEAQGLINVIGEIYKALLLFMTSIDVGAIDQNELMAPIATIINNSVMDAWNSKIVPEFKNDSDGYPDDYAFRKLISRASNCTKLIEQAIKLSDKDDEADITRYENLISIHEYLIDSCSYEYKYIKTGWDVWDGSDVYGWRYVQSLSLNDEAKSSRRQLISQYRTNINNIKNDIARKKAAEKAEKERKEREEAKKRFDAYWAEHAADKERLESERKALQEQMASMNAWQDQQIAILNRQIASIPGQVEINNVDAFIKKLAADKASLGIFKGKQKKALQEQIDQATAYKKSVQDRMDMMKKPIESQIASIKSEIQGRINPLQNRINSINDELTKAR